MSSQTLSANDSASFFYLLKANIWKPLHTNRFVTSHEQAISSASRMYTKRLYQVLSNGLIIPTSLWLTGIF